MWFWLSHPKISLPHSFLLSGCLSLVPLSLTHSSTHSPTLSFALPHAATELESVKSLFAQKEKELAQAVAKVEELTQQLEQLKKGQLNGLNGDTYKSPANEELNRLRQELVVSGRDSSGRVSCWISCREDLNPRPWRSDPVGQGGSDPVVKEDLIL